LRGEPAPFPAAVHLDWVEDFIKQYGEPLQEGSHDPARDVQIGSRLVNGVWTKGTWYRPFGESEARVLARWPSQSELAVWSELAWNLACKNVMIPTGRLQLGLDVALDGPDKCAFAVRRGGVLRHVQSFQGWKPEQQHTHAKELAWRFAQEAGVDPRSVPIVVDDIGCGSKVMACPADGYNFIGYTVSEVAGDNYHYNNRRSELGFALADAARDGEVYFGQLDKHMLSDLKNQFMTMRYEVQANTKRVLKPKKEQKKLLGKSPDEADAVMLSFAAVGGYGGTGERVAGRIG